MSDIPVRSNVIDWYTLKHCAEQWDTGSPIAATTAELDGLWIACYGPGYPRARNWPPLLLGRPVTEVADWDIEEHA